MTSLEAAVPWDSQAILRHTAAWPIANVHAEFASSPTFPALEAWNAALKVRAQCNSSGAPLRFVPHVARRRGAAWVRSELYDGQIFLRGHVPSRANDYHDYFNMCVWRTFPLAKAELNAAQWRALCRWLPDERGEKLPGARLREQDTLALTDEGGVLFVVERTIADDAYRALEAGAESALESIATRREAAAILFGHALYEHLVTGAGEVRGAWVVLPVDHLAEARDDLLAQADEALAAHLRAGPVTFRGAPGYSLRLAERSATTLRAWASRT